MGAVVERLCGPCGGPAGTYHFTDNTANIPLGGMRVKPIVHFGRHFHRTSRTTFDGAVWS